MFESETSSAASWKKKSDDARWMDVKNRPLFPRTPFCHFTLFFFSLFSLFHPTLPFSFLAFTFAMITDFSILSLPLVRFRSLALSSLTPSKNYTHT